MDVISVTKGSKEYEKVLIMLHGGGSDGESWKKSYDYGWFGDSTNIKLVFPTSPLDGHVWYKSFKKPECGLDDDCAYDIPSIKEVGAHIEALIKHEAKPLNDDYKKVYLGGFSQGAQMTMYTQLAQIDFALGGAIVMDGYPLPPLCDMPNHSSAAAKHNATYTGDDMNW